MTAMRDVPLCEHRVTNNLLAIVARGPHARMTVDEWERTANLQPGTLKAMRDGRCNSLDLANIAECERVDVLEILSGNDGRAWSKSLNESVQYLRGKIESLRIRLLDSATLASSIERAPRLMLRRMLLKQRDLDRRIRALTIKMDETASPLRIECSLVTLIPQTPLAECRSTFRWLRLHRELPDLHPV